MKKLFTFFLALVACGEIIWASNTQVDGIWYNFDSSTLTAEVTYRGNTAEYYPSEYSGSIDIPSSVTYNGEIYSVTRIGSAAFKKCTDLTSVIMPNSVMSIEKSAFYGCSKLIHVTISENVTNIGESAFELCEKLSSVYIPNGITTIKNSTFYCCTSLGSVTIPNSVTSIGEHAFGSCAITTLTIPTSVTSIGKAAFSSCEKLTQIHIPGNVTTIGNQAFYICTKLSSVEISDGVTKIEDKAFLNCSNLTSINVPNSVTEVGQYILEGCDRLALPVYNEHTFVRLQPTYSGTYNVPDGITSIAAGAFRNCKDLTFVSIPNTVVAIGESSFYGCNSLAEITIPNEVTSIGYQMFYGCTNLSSINIPNHICCLGKEAFKNCVGLTSITIPESVISFGDLVFDRCSNLEKLVLLPEIPPVIGSNIVDVKTPIDIPCGTLETYKTSDWKKYNIQYPPSEFSLEATSEDPIMGSVEVENNSCVSSVTAIPADGYRFNQWSDGNTDNPRILTLTRNTSLIAKFDIAKSGTCGENSQLTWMYEGKTKTLMINGVGKLTEQYTFGLEAPTHAQNLIIGNDVTSIGDSAFYAMTSINHVVIGGNVESIGDYAFAECKNFDDITCYANTVPTINATTFANVGNKQYIYLFVPEERVRAYKRDSYWGQFDVQALSAQQKETTEVATITTETSVDVTWPSVSGAATYELVIRDKEGNVICTLIFNSAGQLTSIAFAPSRGDAPQKTQTAGFSFTITGLSAGTSYDLTITAKNENGQELDKKNVSFHTDSAEGIEDLHVDSDKPVKVLMDGQIYILRADHIFDTQGKMIK